MARPKRNFQPTFRDLGPPTRLYFFRHGEVDKTTTNGLYGQLDVPLSAKGRQQSEAAARRLDDIPLDAVYTSDLQRAVYMARLIAERHQLALTTSKDFRERHFGDWQNKNWGKIEADWPSLYRRYLEDFPSFQIPGGENFYGIRDRVLRGLAQILARHPHGAVALVAHAGCNRVLIADALGLELSHIFNIWQEPGCLNVIDYYDNGRAIVRLVSG